ncbi:MAG: DUF362 domain-containing protein [Spirochaetota bacterium]
MTEKIITRREFLKSSTLAAIAGALYLCSPIPLFPQPEKKTRVVLIRNKDVLDSLNRPRAEIVKQMLDEAVTALLNAENPVSAWKQLIKPTDVVGIKSNNWHYLPTPPELEAAIKRRVLDAGVSEKNIGIRDRGLLSDKVFLNATALINVRPIRTHYWSGVGSLLKNYIQFVGQPSSYHGDSCAELAAIWNLPLVKGKTRLNILVLLTPLFHGIGPHHFSPKYTWPYKGLLAGVDPVAVDSVGVRILLAKRREFFGEERPLNPPPKHIFLADTRYRLGTAEPAKIELVKIGWQEDLLID